MEFPGIGSTGGTVENTDLYWLYELPKVAGEQFCNVYNQLVASDVSTVPSSGIWGSPSFDGTFLSPLTASAATSGKTTLCFRYAPDRFMIYFVVLAR